jgi:hypothetical protein
VNTPIQLPGPHDTGSPQNAAPAPHVSVRQTGLLSSLTLSIGSLMLRCNFEIQRVGGRKAADRPGPHPVFRTWLRRLLRLVRPRSSRSPRIGSDPALLGGQGTLDPAEQAVSGRPGRAAIVVWDGAGGGPGLQPGAGGGGTAAADWLTASFPVGHPAQQILIGQNCTVILSDVVGFGALTRTDDDRRIIRDALFGMTHAALQYLPDVWSWDDRGDGLLTVVPPSVPTMLVIRHLHKQLPAALEQHNRAHQDPAQIRLRVAINVGPVVTDTMGVSGEAIIVAARLVEAPLFKEAMERSQAALGVITSAFIHDTVIRHDLDLAGYFPVQANVKETSLPAWMRLFGPPGGGHGGREQHLP